MFVFLGIEFVVTGLYVNLFVAMLHARNTLRLRAVPNIEDIALTPLTSETGPGNQCKVTQLANTQPSFCDVPGEHSSSPSMHAPIYDSNKMPDAHPENNKRFFLLDVPKRPPPVALTLASSLRRVSESSLEDGHARDKLVDRNTWIPDLNEAKACDITAEKNTVKDDI
ncbi:hypothetical protein AcW1_005232 [Taiwanofungus camphoratus]|nr:hypothetical protein AcW2_004002 [Antrodia cinnamomea]KAI0956592.1 hypothetical protein AcW1_005232 [Antrodia cinnamomea]